MRSTKNRSRSKGNRSRSSQGGNIVNRVFNSSGPEGKVRGTPQQIIEKYNQLTRDAQLSNDRVAAENFQQHAEHYLRMLGEAQREMDARSAQQQQQHDGGQGSQQGNQGNQGNQDGQQAGGSQGGGNQGGGSQGGSSQGGGSQGGGRNRRRSNPGGETPQPAQGDQPMSDAEAQSSFEKVMDSSLGESGLVDTPEAAAKPKRAPRTRRRKPAVEAGGETGGDGGGEGGGSDQPPQEAAE